MQTTDYKIYDNEIPLNTVKTWEEVLMKDISWKPVGWSGDAREPYRHWAAYPVFEGDIKSIWQSLDYSFKEDGYNLKPERVVTNLFGFGDSSWVHRDTDRSGEFTVLIYLNDFWDINWGGFTMLVDDQYDLIKAVKPMPGRFIMFPSDMIHGAAPVSREAPYPRFSLVYQCKRDKNLS